IPRQTGWVDLGDEFDPAPSQNRNIVRLPDGTSLLIGGMFWASDNTGLIGPMTVTSAEIFDPAANGGEGGFTGTLPFSGDLTDTAPFQAELDKIAVVQLPSGKVLTAGPSLQLFDPATRSFQVLEGNLAGVQTAGALLPDGRVALLGAGGPFVYDPSTGVFTAFTSLGCSLANSGDP